MSAEEAIKKLEDALDSTYAFYGYVKLPIHDVVIKGRLGTFEEYSFRELIKTAYNLKEIDENESK